MSTTLTVPQTLYRTARLERSAVAGNKLRMSISSDEPYKRYDWDIGEYWEKLDHSAGGLLDDRLKAGIPILWNHDRDVVLGRAESGYKIVGGKCEIEATLSSAPDVASHIERIREGTSRDTSIGYELVGEGRCIGAKDELPIYLFKFRIFEASVVSVPADFSVGIGRTQTQPHQTRTITIMDNEPDTSTTEPPNSQRRMTRTQEADHARKIREFVDALRNPTWKKAAAQVGEESIVQGKTFEEFRAAALPHFTSTAFIDEPHASDFNNRSMGGMNNRSVGAQIVAHPKFREALSGGRQQLSFNLPHIRSIREFTSRAINTTSEFGVTSQQLSGVQGVAFERLTVADLLASGTTSAGKISYPREASFTPSATSVAETEQKPEQAFDIENAEASAKKIAAWTKISTELSEDSPAAIDYIQARLAFAVQKAEDRAILYGDGIGANMKGILSTSGIQVLANPDNTSPADTIRRGIGAIDINTDFQATGLVMGPALWQEIELIKDMNGRYIVGQITVPDEFGRPRLAPALWGLPVAVSKSVTGGTCIVGAFAQAAQLFRRTGMLIQMTNCDQDDFTRNLITILAETRAALAVYAPSAFVEVTGLA